MPCCAALFVCNLVCKLCLTVGRQFAPLKRTEWMSCEGAKCPSAISGPFSLHQPSRFKYASMVCTSFGLRLVPRAAAVRLKVFSTESMSGTDISSPCSHLTCMSRRTAAPIAAFSACSRSSVERFCSPPRSLMMAILVAIAVRLGSAIQVRHGYKASFAPTFWLGCRRFCCQFSHLKVWIGVRLERKWL